MRAAKAAATMGSGMNSLSMYCLALSCGSLPRIKAMAGRLIRYGYRSTSSCLLSEKTVRRDVVNPAAAVIAARGVMSLVLGPISGRPPTPKS
jgi:hypothetical protein